MIDDDTRPEPTADPATGRRFTLIREFPWIGVVTVFDWVTGQGRDMSENAFRYYQDEGA